MAIGGQGEAGGGVAQHNHGQPGHRPRAEAEIQAELFERTRDCSIYMERYQLYADMEVLPDDAIAELLDRVTVWPDGRLEVSLKFLNEMPVSAVAERETKTAE